MTEISKDIFNDLFMPDRVRGETSSRKGIIYENEAGFFILKNLEKILGEKFKNFKLTFNGLEDLDIYDEKGRIFSFQIKYRSSKWSSSNYDIKIHLINCINRFKVLKDKYEISYVNFYFFINITCDLLEDWKTFHINNPDKLHSHPKLPVDIKEKLNSYGFSIEEKDEIFSRIYFITNQEFAVLRKNLDGFLLKRYKEYREKKNPDDFIDKKELAINVVFIDPVIKKKKETYCTLFFLFFLSTISTIFNPKAPIRIFGLSLNVFIFYVFLINYFYDIIKEKKGNNEKIEYKYLIGVVCVITPIFVFLSLLPIINNIIYGDLTFKFINIIGFPVYIAFYYWTRKYITPGLLILLHRIYWFLLRLYMR